MQARTLLFPLVLFVTGCSTGAWFKLPDETRLLVNERPASFDQGLVRSRPFSLPAGRSSINDGQERQAAKPLSGGFDFLAAGRHRILADGLRPTLL